MDRSRLEMAKRARKLLNRESPEDVEKALAEMNITPKEMEASIKRFMSASSKKVLVINPTRTIKMVPETSVNLGKEPQSIKIGPYIFCYGDVNKAKNKRASKIIGEAICGEVVVKGALSTFDVNPKSFMKWEAGHNNPKYVCNEDLDAVNSALDSVLDEKAEEVAT